MQGSQRSNLSIQELSAGQLFGFVDCSRTQAGGNQ